MTKKHTKNIDPRSFYVHDGGEPATNRPDIRAIYPNKQEKEEDGTIKIKIKYLTEELKEIEVKKNSNWVDLRCAVSIYLKKGEHVLIPLGVAIELPEEYEAYIVPRSSTLNNFGIIQGNHFGVVDSSYCGDEDEWKMSAYALRDTVINKNDRICQFRIQKKQPVIKIEKVDSLGNENRGGFGSTGVL
jgi:dUTP pyrophosphatase